MLRKVTRGAAGRRASERLIEAVRSRLEMASAVARERLLETHVKQALELVELAEGRVAAARAIDIYGRVHRLSVETNELVRTRALASLGQTEARTGRPTPLPEEQLDPDPEASPDQPWIATLLGERFRPRVHLELRRWIELHTGRAEVRILQTHVENALRFCEILDEDMSYIEAIGIYIESLNVSTASAETIMYFTLDFLSREHLPIALADAPQVQLDARNPDRPGVARQANLQRANGNGHAAHHPRGPQRKRAHGELR